MAGRIEPASLSCFTRNTPGVNCRVDDMHLHLLALVVRPFLSPVVATSFVTGHKLKLKLKFCLMAGVLGTARTEKGSYENRSVVVFAWASEPLSCWLFRVRFFLQAKSLS